MPASNNNIITLAHGGGGVKTGNLIKDIIAPHLKNAILDQMDDAAVLNLPSTRIAFSTDSYVVTPLIFPGGDIGKLAACGTINDLVMQGAKPLYLSLGLILEEGLEIAVLEQIIISLAAVVQSCNVQVVTGDTKVVERGKGNGIFINTTGIGVLMPDVNVHAGNARPGDVVIVSGTIGDHGIAVLSKRAELGFTTELKSDTAALWPMIQPLLAAIPQIRSLRDHTRGGVAAALCDIAAASKTGIRIFEKQLPVKPAVRGACSLMGFDPLNIANEGKAIIICPPECAAQALSIIRNHPLGENGCIIGEVIAEPAGLVLLKTAMGGQRIVEIPSGEDLPRIC